MTWIIYGLGVITGIAISIAYNYFKPTKFDQITDKAAKKVKDKL